VEASRSLRYNGASSRGNGRLGQSQREKVFDRMCRMEARLTPGTGDIGLGLAICKGFLEAHGGRIYIESEVGKGTTSRFTLPLHGEEG
jgi:hypothetical protein